jgi:site-specific recombinase XerD
MKGKGRIAAWYVSKFNFSNRQATTPDLVLRSRFANDAGMPAEKQHPHVLKYSIASHLVSANINLALVKQQLGHKSIGSTIRYVTMSDQQASKATANALMKIF